MKPIDFITAARVPDSLTPQVFGPWTIERRRISPAIARFDVYTLLFRTSLATLHLEGPGEVVMEDSRFELQQHLPIWLHAKGRVLVTGLGLGCVVRGLLASPDVEDITVVEIDRSILRVVGHEFESNRRVRLVHGDAFRVQLPGRFDFAWHDLWTDGEAHLQTLHAALLVRYCAQCRWQGAWQLPRWFKRRAPSWVLR